MGQFVVSPGATVIDQFPAFEDDGYNKRTGLTLGGGDFSLAMFKDGAVDATSVAIAEIGATGEYKVTYVPATVGFYHLQILIDFSKDIRFSETTASASSPAAIAADLARLLGLSHENIVMKNQKYDIDSQLEEADLFLYDSKANALLDDEVTGLVASYKVVSTWGAINENTFFRMVRES